VSESFVRFEEIARNPKTRVWAVLSAESGDALGLVQWRGPWRCYSFFPAQLTVFEQKCLRDIATFCEVQTGLHRKGMVAV